MRATLLRRSKKTSVQDGPHGRSVGVAIPRENVMSNKFRNMMVALAAIVVCFFSLNAMAAPEVDPTARVKAVAAQAKADKAEADAANANAKAATAQAAAVTAGTNAATAAAALGRQLNSAVAGARAAAANGDRNLEKELKATADKLQTQIDKLSKHECGAFTEASVQNLCLATYEKVAMNGQNAGKDVAINGQNRTSEVEMAKVAATKSFVTEDFGHANQRLDMVKAIAMGCVTAVTVVDGVSKPQVVCPKDRNQNGALTVQFEDISKNGVRTEVISTEGGSGSGTSFLKIVAAGLVGALPGAAIGHAMFPNSEPGNGGHWVRHYEGAIGGAGTGFVIGAVAMATYEWLK